MSSDLKKDFEELRKMAEEERAKEKTGTEQKKTMEELIKESEEATKLKEEELKKEFKGMKGQKTSVEFSDVVGDFVNRSKNAYGKVKESLSETRKKFAKMRITRKETKVETQEEYIEEAKKEEDPKAEVEGEKTTERFVEPIEESEEEGEENFITKGRNTLSKFLGNIDTKLEKKMPGAYKVYSASVKWAINLWNETFPDREGKVLAKMERVKKMAKEQNELEEQIKEMNEDEIKEIQEKIPEHMRNALIIKAEENKDQGGVWDIIANSEAAKELRESEEYKEFTDLKKGIKDIADTFKETFSASDSPIVAGIKSLAVINYWLL